MRVRLGLILCFGLCYFVAFGQQYIWWNNLVNWDGTTPWPQYMTIAPNTLGPNALPIPEFKNGLVTNKLLIKNHTERFWGSGDATTALGLHLNVPIVKGKIAVEAWGVPLEWFRVDAATRDHRATRDFVAAGTAQGDLYLGTIIQILNRPKLPQVTFSYNLKTASGNNLENARFTDSPGYWFDLAAGKSLYLKKTTLLDSIRLSAQTGFYVWQTTDYLFNQNDAIMYAIQMHLYKNYWEFLAAWGGFSGYIGNGDKPQVLRVDVTRSIGDFQASIRYTKAMRDYKYNAIRFTLGYCFNN